MSSGFPESAAQRNGPLPVQKSGRMYSGTKPGMSKASADAGFLRLAADVVPVVEGPGAALLEVEHRPDVDGHRPVGSLDVIGGILAPQPERLLVGQGRWGHTR